MSTKSNVQQWQDKVNSSLKVRDEWVGSFNVELARLYFEGKQRPEWARPEEWISLNMIYSHLQSQLPTLYSMDPYFYVNLAKTHQLDAMLVAQWEQKGKIRQSMLNYKKKELKLKKKARLSIQDAHFSYGVIKTHYIANLKDNEKAGQTITDELGEPVLDEFGEELVHPDIIPANGRYAITRVDPDDLIFGGDAGPLEEDWPWLAERLRMPLYEVRQDKRFDKTAVKQIAEKVNRNKNSDGDPEDEIIVLYEIYDIDRNMFMIISMDTRKPLVKPQPIPVGIEDHPYSILRFTLRAKSAYPIPPMSQGIDPQREYNELRSKQLVHRKRFNRKYEVNVNGFAEDADSEIAKLEIGEDGTILRKQTGDQVVRPIADAALDQSNYTELGLLKQDMNELLGATDAARGVARADSATEAGIIDKRLDVKEGDKQSIVIDWLADIAKKLDQLIQTHIQGDEAVKITGPEGDKWELVRADDYDDIDGEYDYQIDIGSTQPKIPGIERAQWIAFLNQVVIPMPSILTKPRIMEKMAKMFGIEDKAMIQEFSQMGQEIIQSQGAGTNNQGSQAGVPQQNDVGAVMGAANGLLGGNINGGGNSAAI